MDQTSNKRAEIATRERVRYLRKNMGQPSRVCGVDDEQVSAATPTRRSRDLIENPGAGAACSFGATDDLKVTELQAMANLEKHTSGWLQANPAFFPNRMNDAAF
jgi:hypothetical protein